MVRHDMNRPIEQLNQTFFGKIAGRPDLVEVALTSRPFPRRVRQLPCPVGYPVCIGRVGKHCRKQDSGLGPPGVNDVRRTWLVRDTEEGIMQGGRGINQLRIDAETPQGGVLEAGATRQTILPSDRTHDYDTAEIAGA